MKKLLAIGLLAVAAFATISQEAPAFFGKKKSKLIQIKGSDTITPVSQGVAEQYMAENKKAKIAVLGGGSGTGAAALVNGTTDIAQMSRGMKAKEYKAIEAQGKKVKEIIIGNDCITVAVNKNNPVSNVTLAQLRDIYLGKITNWKQLGGKNEKIILLSRDNSSGTHSTFKKMALRSKKAGGNGSEEYTNTTIYLPSNEAIVQELKTSEGAIGYIGLGFFNSSISMLAINGVKPSPETALDYALTRSLFWYITDDISPEAQKVVDYMMSAKGQAIVTREGFVEVK